MSDTTLGARGLLERVDRLKWQRVLILFLVAKVVTFVAAAVAVTVMEYPRQLLRQVMQVWPDEAYEDNFSPLTMTTHYDSEHYIRLVGVDYFAPITPGEQDVVDRAAAGEYAGCPNSLHRFTFGPMLPMLGKVLAPVLGAEWALWVIVNVAMIACLTLLHDLTKQLFGDRIGALDSAIWLVLLPCAFVLQGVLTESLFLAGVLATFVLAEKKKWLWAAIPAFMVGLTRSSGFLIALPLLLVVLRQVGYRPTTGKAWALIARAFPAGIAAGVAWGGFLVYCHHFTGDYFAYSHLQHSGWGVTVGPPTGFFESLVDFGRPFVKAWSVVLIGAVLLLGVRLVPVAYQVLGWVLLLVPLMIGANWQQSILRYEVEVFPVAWVAASFLRGAHARSAGMAASAMMQGVLLLSWVAAWTRMIV